jgi:hypothetical protein
MPCSATPSGDPLPDHRHAEAPIHPHKCETPPEAGFRQSGSSYLPPGRTSCEAGVHQSRLLCTGVVYALEYRVTRRAVAFAMTYFWQFAKCLN